MGALGQIDLNASFFQLNRHELGVFECPENRPSEETRRPCCAPKRNRFSDNGL